MTRQFSPEEMAELQARIDRANQELAETQSFQGLQEAVNEAIESSATPQEESVELL